MAKRKDFSSSAVFEAWSGRFSQGINKKFYQQGTGIYIRRKRTSNTAVSVVNKLRKVPVDSVRLSLSVYHNDGSPRLN